MPVTIKSVEKGSPADRAGVKPGDVLASINGNGITDVLDYRFYMIDERLELELLRPEPVAVRVVKAEYEDLGLGFGTYLIDRQHTCRNRCVFCFVDQLPKGLRRSLYFKDDDSRMSFLFGSYVTLTNMQEEDVRRIVKMRLSPVNISVHTTDPELRVRMMNNRRAGEVLRYLPILTGGGIRVNAQLVLCPGLNDGDALRRSLSDLLALGDNLQSIALVPVGLTRHREGLYPLRTMTPAEAAACIDIAEEYGEKSREETGLRRVYCADELFILAGRPMPEYGYYDDFSQLENGVGTVALTRRQFSEALAELPASRKAADASLVCGVAAAPYLEAMFASAAEKFPNLRARVYAVPNQLFGDTVTVTGLLCGRDILDFLKGKPLGERLLLPDVTLRHEQDRFLDDMTLPEFRAALPVPAVVCSADGGEMLRAALGPEPR